MGSNGKKSTILVIDDDALMLQSIKRLLSFGEKYHVEILPSAINVHQKMNECSPDLVIVDIKMRGIDGFEVCTQIRQDKKNDHIKIMAISGTVDAGDIDRMLSLGADSYLEKPFNNDEFIGGIDKLLNDKLE